MAFLGIQVHRCVILIVINNLVCFFLQNARSTLNFHEHIYFMVVANKNKRGGGENCEVQTYPSGDMDRGCGVSESARNVRQEYI